MSKSKFNFKKQYLNFNSKDIDVQKVGERLENLKTNNGGILTTEIVVADAKKKNSVLHKAFEWDTNKAAEEWLKQQARSLINSIEVTIVTEERTVKAPVFISSVKSEYQGGREYKGLQDVLNDEDEKEKLFSTMKAEIDYFIKKYEKFEFLSSYVNQIRVVSEALEPELV